MSAITRVHSHRPLEVTFEIKMQNPHKVNRLYFCIYDKELGSKGIKREGNLQVNRQVTIALPRELTGLIFSLLAYREMILQEYFTIDAAQVVQLEVLQLQTYTSLKEGGECI